MLKARPRFIVVHLVWSTSARRALLAPDVDGQLIAVLGRQASAVACTLLAAGCATNHVHALVQMAPTATLGELARRLKGGSSHGVNASVMLREPLRWQQGYWAQSVGPAELPHLERYVRGQRAPHQDEAAHEGWLHG